MFEFIAAANPLLRDASHTFLSVPGLQHDSGIL
jgi:hypothetical protein